VIYSHGPFVFLKWEKYISVANNENNFWVNLLKKVLNIILKNVGLSSSSRPKHQHVVPHEDGWAIKGEGNTRYTEVFDRQSDAIDRAKEIARNYNADVIIHRADGTIRDRVSV
jgi:hypothetical protein